MPEVVGDAAITVDPYDTAALVRGFQALDQDAELRARLRITRADGFTLSSDPPPPWWTRLTGAASGARWLATTHLYNGG